jgi:class 3 adenylate cyclase/ligand-binding sensor domain-containing protein
MIVIRLFIFFSLSLTITLTYGQKGAPFLKNFLAKDYNEDLREQHSSLAGAHNFAGVLDGRGIVYIGNEKGVLEYDGTHWRLLRLPDSLPAKVLAKDDKGRIFVGSKNQFGYLGADSVGRLKYYSLSTSIKQQIGEIEDIYTFGTDVYFTTSNRVYRRNVQDKVTSVSFNPDANPVSTIQHLVYVPAWGVVNIEGDIAYPVTGLASTAKSKTKIRTILPFDEKRVLFVVENGLFLFNGEKIVPFVTGGDAFFKRNTISDAVILPDEKLVVGTVRGGLVWLSRKGKVELILDRVGGLPGQTINGFAVDMEGGLWIALNEGISRAEIVSPLTRFEATSELQGSVQSILFQNNTLYVATTMGLYYLNKTKQKFMPVVGIVSNAWALETLNNRLYAATSFGIYIIKGDSALIVSNQPARSLTKMSYYDNKIYVGLFKGMGIITESKKMVKTKKKVGKADNKNPNDTVQTKQPFGEIEVVGYAHEANFQIIDTTLGVVKQIHFDRPGAAWIFTEQNLQYITIRKDSITSRVNAPSGLPEGDIRIFRTSKGILFGTNKGIFYYDRKEQKMLPYSWLGAEWDHESISYLFEDPKHNVLLATRTGIAYGKWDNQNKSFAWHRTEFRRLTEILVNHVYYGMDGAHWIGSERGIIHFDPLIDKNYFKPYPAVIRKAEYKSGDKWKLLFGGTFLNSSGNPIIEQDSISKTFSADISNVNIVRFQYASPFYDGDAGILFRHRIIGPGYGQEWSAWTTNTTAEYAIGDNGKYSFEVVARNVYGNNSQTAHYDFVVQPQWYETAPARFAFILLGLMALGGIVFGLVKYQTARLRKRNIELQAAIDAATEDIRREKQKSEDLLLNILPKQIAEELKVKNATEAQEYALVSVLFTDFKGFTNVAEKLTPNELINELNICFSAFDEIIGKHGIEKIKTIGDAYMCAGGIPDPNTSNPVDVILAGLEIQDFMRRMGEEKARKGEAYWQLRLGIHTGELVAGVVGKKKFAYDIWGDTVNTASRMESSGEPMKVNISGMTYVLVKDFFVCTHRGKIPAKNKGDIDMYFVERIIPELSADEAGLFPNDLFLKKLEQLKKLLAKQYRIKVPVVEV